MASNLSTILAICLKKTARDLAWSLIIVGVLASCLTASMLVPSIGTSLQNGLNSYANQLAPWIVIAPKAGCPIPSECQLVLPDSVVQQIQSTSGVAEVYPVLTNLTAHISYNVTEISNGKNVTWVSESTLYTSAVIGTAKGYPIKLVGVSNGSLPTNAAPEFVYTSLLPVGLRVNQTYQMYMASNFGNLGRQISPIFNATAVGALSMNPLFGDVQLLWNSSFIEQLLGPTLFQQTFGGKGTNYIIVRASTLQDVPNVISQINSIIAPYPAFVSVYNQELIQSLQSFQSQTGPLYAVLGVVSIFALVVIFFLLAHLVAGRRNWEAGLLISQGWSWRSLYLLYVCYFLLLGAISLVLSLVLSTQLSKFWVFHYTLFVEKLEVSVTVDPLFVIVGLVLVVGIAFLASSSIIRRFRRMGVERMVGEF